MEKLELGTPPDDAYLEALAAARALWYATDSQEWNWRRNHLEPSSEDNGEI
jgi:hypothetical protein